MKYAVINKMDIVNGPGIRVSLFVSGCKFHCLNCFNKEEQNFEYGKEYTEETEEKLIECLDKPYVAGLSILGGDPLWQTPTDMALLKKLADKVHDIKKTVWIWSGFTFEQIFPKIVTDDFNLTRSMQQFLISSCDVWVDGLFVDDLKDMNLIWKGSSNQRVIDIKKTLANKYNDIVLYS